VKLNHIDVVKLRLDIVALPDKYVEEVMATYATYEAVQKIDAVSLWERMPMKQVPGHTIMQCKATVREIEDEPNAIHFELLDAAMDSMPWAWRNIEYRRQALFEGVEHRTDRGPMGNSPELREALMDRIALNIVVEHL
jgi:hypothetical protein